MRGYGWPIQEEEAGEVVVGVVLKILLQDYFSVKTQR
jgi:hypothetical protein